MLMYLWLTMRLLLYGLYNNITSLEKSREVYICKKIYILQPINKNITEGDDFIMKNDSNKSSSKNKEDLFKLLLENNEDKIKQFVISNGKAKSYCPIRFYDKSKTENN